MKGALKAAQLISVVVQEIDNYGAVIDTHGFSGLLHIEEIADRW